ncbi:integral membrane protein [Nannizzia gypsea CBS 118893]|uniref:Integral membrane protein n=1 Tax=Arthroderma gypseum (strain ATCC MYA-4604 / CBS 118893) TaxID=535722 RepID=E4V201_ARTGP|nr:integral membrane protein [Nannizzia gypsea CBS 118893]EFR04066.1 integral membrane protein [Nannizzia gypsea CBS 118893]
MATTDEGRIITAEEITEQAPLLRREGDEGVRNSHPRLSRARSTIIILGLTGVTFLSCVSNGLLVVGLPAIAYDLELPDHLLFWFDSPSGCVLLLAGSLADLIGDRSINILGTITTAIAILGTGLSRTGMEMIIYRLVQGIGVSMCLPTGVSIITRSFPPGPQRNIGFASLGLSQPLGFSVGMVAEGLFSEAPGGWRLGFYGSASVALVLTISNLLVLPSDNNRAAFKWGDLLSKVDWVGILIASSCMGIISYICAILTDDVANIQNATHIVLIVFALALIPAFGFWMHWQGKRDAPALIPNSMWKNTVFVSISLIVFFTWAVILSSELVLSLFFQKVQLLSPFDTSIRLLPNVIIGIILNLSTGLFVHLVRVNYLVIVVSLVAAIAPLLMAIIDPSWNYWICAFWGVLLGPVAIDVVFTIAHLMITDIFPSSTQALAGAVFNTIAQLGSSVGLSAIAVISAAVEKSSPFPDQSPKAIMAGYRAAFWACFGTMLIVAFIGFVGLRNVRKLGVGDDHVRS